MQIILKTMLGGRVNLYLALVIRTCSQNSNFPIFIADKRSSVATCYFYLIFSSLLINE